jgi:nicotinamidase/pyrazinamidase
VGYKKRGFCRWMQSRAAADVMKKMDRITMMLSHWLDSQNVEVNSPEYKFARAQSGVALLIIDVQRDFCPAPDGQNQAGWGALPVPSANEIVPVINKFKGVFPFGKVALSKDWHPKGHVSFASAHTGKKTGDVMDIVEGGVLVKQALWPDHCVQDTPGAELHPALDVVTEAVWDGLRYTYHSDDIYTKGRNKYVDSYSAFYDNSGRSTEVLDELLKFQGITDVVIVGLAFDYCVKFTALDAVKNKLNVTVCVDGCKPVSAANNAASELRDGGVTVTTCDEYIKYRKEKFSRETGLKLAEDFPSKR